MEVPTTEGIFESDFLDEEVDGKFMVELLDIYYYSFYQLFHLDVGLLILFLH